MKINYTILCLNLLLTLFSSDLVSIDQLRIFNHKKCQAELNFRILNRVYQRAAIRHALFDGDIDLKTMIDCDLDKENGTMSELQYAEHEKKAIEKQCQREQDERALIIISEQRNERPYESYQVKVFGSKKKIQKKQQHLIEQNEKKKPFEKIISKPIPLPLRQEQDERIIIFCDNGNKPAFSTDTCREEVLLPPLPLSSSSSLKVIRNEVPNLEKQITMTPDNDHKPLSLTEQPQGVVAPSSELGLTRIKAPILEKQQQQAKLLTAGTKRKIETEEENVDIPPKKKSFRGKGIGCLTM